MKPRINQVCRFCGKKCKKSTTDTILTDVIYSLKAPFEIEEKLKYHKSCAVKYHRQQAELKRETKQNLLNKTQVSKSIELVCEPPCKHEDAAPMYDSQHDYIGRYCSNCEKWIE